LGGIFGAVIGGSQNAKAVKKASAAQQAGIQQAIDEQRRQFDLTRGDFQPYQQAGASGLGQLGDILGINGPEKQQAALGMIQGSPMLAGLIRNGEEAVLQNASATGGLRGGNTQRGLADFRADAFNQVLQQQIGHLGGLAGMGMGSSEAVGNFGQNAANQIGSGLTSIGNSRAGSVLGQQQAWNNMSSQIQSILANVMGGMG